VPLVPHLTDANHGDVLAAARHKTKRDVELLVAGLRPQPSVPASIRKLPTAKANAIFGLLDVQSSPGATIEFPPRTAPTVIKPLAPERYKVQFTISRETHDKLCHAQALLRHAIPTGDVAIIFDRALTLLVGDLRKRKVAEVRGPRANVPPIARSRHIPASVRRAVWARDKGRCAFAGARGRCSETGFLEFHHVVPYADGGASSVGNIELRCRAHNAYEADQWFGPLFAERL
jgi:hypothetical protein